MPWGTEPSPEARTAAVLAEFGAEQSGGDYLVPHPESPRDLVPFQSLYGEDSPEARAFDRALTAARIQDVEIAGETFTRVGDLNAPSVAVASAFWPQLRANAFYHSKWGNLVSQPIVAQLVQQSYRYGYGGSRLNDFMRVLTVAVVAVGGAAVIGSAVIASAAAEGATISAIEGGAVIASEGGAVAAVEAPVVASEFSLAGGGSGVGIGGQGAGLGLSVEGASAFSTEFGLAGTGSGIGLQVPAGSAALLAPALSDPLVYAAPVTESVTSLLDTVRQSPVIQSAASSLSGIGRAAASMLGGEGGEVVPLADTSASGRARLGLAVGYALLGFMLYKLARA